MRRQPTPEQKAKAAERREKFRQLTKAVAAMTEEQRLQMLDRFGTIVTCEGRALSAFNACLLISQLETVSMVGGFQQWKRNNRTVRKGERGLAIWIPTAGTTGTAKAEEIELDDDESQKPNFIMGTVFDISQTEELAQEQEEAA